MVNKRGFKGNNKRRLRFRDLLQGLARALMARSWPMCSRSLNQPTLICVHCPHPPQGLYIVYHYGSDMPLLSATDPT
jgi:hypothetical protein